MASTTLSTTDTTNSSNDALDALLDERDERKARKAKTVHLADVVRHDGPGIQIPRSLNLSKAIEILVRKHEEEEEVGNVSAVIPAFPYDGALALKKAMDRMFGFVVAKKCICGRNHNTDIKIVTDAKGTTETVPWGDFQVPNIEGHLSTSYAWEGKRVVFRVTGSIKGKDKPAFNELMRLVTKIATEESIYKGKAFGIRFKDDDGDTHPIPEIRFMDVSQAVQPIYKVELEEAFENDVLAYITHGEMVRPLNGGYLKRGILLDGEYGTGKTLASEWVARKGLEHGWTYFLVTNPEEFYDTYMMAMAYQPAIIFTEDVDKIAGNDRTAQVDKLLNVLDGVNTKHVDIVTIFTTNHSDKVSEAMYRPGRIDFRMRVTAPDAEAAVRIAISYAKGRIEGSAADFAEAGVQLDGMIPPVIKEAVARSQIRAIRRTNDPQALISNVDLVAAAVAIKNERMVDRQSEDEWTKFGKDVGSYAMRKAGFNLAENPKS